jgi:hypothetical protein
MNNKIIILTRTFFKHEDILIQNLCKTLNVFVNRDKYKFGVILDDESNEDHILGDKLLNNMLADNIYYEPLNSDYQQLFQALAYPHMSWGYDRQQWSTFYMDTYVKEDIIGVVDSDSTFTSYLTDETIFTTNGKLKIKGVKPNYTWKHWYTEYSDFIFVNGSQYMNDNIALKFDTEVELMFTNIMPIFFYKETLKNFRDYISNIWGMSFDEAYKIFSRRAYCQFNILANYALKFESDKYEFIDIFSDVSEKVAVAQNGCPTTRDTLCGLVKSFKLSEDDLINSNIIIQKSNNSSFGGCVDISVNYQNIIDDTRHTNNCSHVSNNPCLLEEINEHYKNVYRDIDNLTEIKKNELNNKVMYFLKHDFNHLIIKG